MQRYKWFVLSLVVIFSAVAFVPVIAFPWQEEIDWQSFELAYAPQPVVFNVDTYLDEVDISSNDFSCVTATEHCSLRAAIFEAIIRADDYGDIIINLPAGTYVLDKTEIFQPHYHLYIVRASQSKIIIQGVGPDQTIIQGNGKAGLFIVQESVEFRDLKFYNPYTNGGVPAIVDIRSRADIKLIRTIVLDAGSYNGAIDVQADKTYLSLENTSMIGSHTNYNGGAIRNMGGVVIIRNSTISDNSANGLGGGIYSENGVLIIENSTISRNNSQTNGGGIYINGGKLSVYNSTIYGNEVLGAASIAAATGLGGTSSPLVFMSNSILFSYPEDGHPVCAPENGNVLSINSGGYNLIGELGVCSIVAGSEDKIGVLPMINPLGQNSGLTQTHSLQPDSPAINGGNPDGCFDSNQQILTIDQRGYPRPSGSIDSRCDIGAYEWDGWPSVFLPLITR